MVERYDKGEPGDFYVEAECCMSCGIPVDIAPDIFAFDDRHCFVKRQPVQPDEIDRTLEVMNSQEVGCIRYAGHDLDIIRRLMESGEGASCDSDLRTQFREQVRSVLRVTFPALSAIDFLRALVAFPRSQKMYDGTQRYTFSDEQAGDVARITFAWSGKAFHSLTVQQQADDVFLVRLYPLMADQAVSRIVHGWLAALDQASEITWMTDAEYDAGARGAASPF